MERPVKTDNTTYYVLEFAGGQDMKRLRLQNASTSVDAFVRFCTYVDTVPSKDYFDVIVPFGGDVIVELEDFSVKVMICNPVPELSVFRW